MRRREFITGLGVTAAMSIAAAAQQPATPVIGFLNGQSPEGFADQIRGFRQGLKEVGFVEDENLTIEYRWAENQPDRLRTMAAEGAISDSSHRGLYSITSSAEVSNVCG